MLIPVLIFLAAFGAGVFASARWLPDLAPGQVGGLAFFLVCGMLGAALGLVGVEVFGLVEDLGQVRESSHELFSSDKAQIVAGFLRLVTFEGGSLVALAAVIYLLAPPADEDDEPREQPQAEAAV